MTHNLYILLTDDDEDDRFLFQEALQCVDPTIHCDTAKNGREALSFLGKLHEKLPDVIFLDINMPQLNGWEFLSLIKQNSALSFIPIIMYSTSSHTVHVEKAKDLGAWGFCTKPDAMDELVRILKFIVKNFKQGLNLNSVADLNTSNLTIFHH